MNLNEWTELFVGMMVMVVAGAVGVKPHDLLIGGLIGGVGGIIVEHTVYRAVRRLLCERTQLVDRLTRYYVREFSSGRTSGGG